MDQDYSGKMMSSGLVMPLNTNQRDWAWWANKAVFVTVRAFKEYGSPMPVQKIHTKSSSEQKLSKKILKFSLLEEELTREAKVEFFDNDEVESSIWIISQ